MDSSLLLLAAFKHDHFAWLHFTGVIVFFVTNVVALVAKGGAWSPLK